MQWSFPEVVQQRAVKHSQIHKRGVTVVKIGPWQLLEILLDHLRVGFGLVEVDAGDRGEVNVRIDQAGDEKLSFPGNYVCAGGRLQFVPLDANDPAVFDQDAAGGDVIEVFRRNDGDVGDPGGCVRLP